MVFKNMFDWLVTPPDGSDGDNKRMTPNRFVPAHLAQQPALNIIVCDFDGVNGRDIAKRLLNDLGSQSSVMIQHISKKLRIDGKGTLVERMVAAAETGRKWLVGADADILLWGEISQENGGVIIRFLCTLADADAQPGSVGLGDSLELPVNYDADMAGVIHALVLAAVGPRKPHPQREEIRDLIIDSAVKLSAYVEVPLEGLEQARFSSVMTAVGNVLASTWRLSENQTLLDKSIKAYQMALADSYDEDNPLNWALTQNHLASALQAQAARDLDAVPLKAAAEAYRSVAAALGSHLHVNDWALAHSHLGDVLVKLSNYENTVQRLKEATEAYQQALKVFARQTMPGPWSELMNQLGVALMSMGENVSGDRVLEQSAACFRQALEVRRREIAPLLWAQTTNNLGAVTFSLYKRNENMAILNEVAACFRGAFEVYSLLGHKEKAIVAQRNMGRIKEIQDSGGL
jgi:tetratricopeptide (TPR) repeat protein